MTRNKNITNGIFMGFINNILTIILPFITRTIIIYKLGTDYVGLGGLFTSILQVLSLTELGFSGAITFALYKPILQRDLKHINALLSLYRFVYRLVGISIIFISIILIPILPELVDGGLPDHLNLYVLYFIYVFNTVVSYFFSAYKSVIFNASERYDIEITIKSGVLILQYVLQSIVLLLFDDYYIYVIILPIATIINNIINSLIVKKKYPDFKPEGKISKFEIYNIIRNVGGAFFSKIGLTIYNSADTIVISAFLGLNMLGRYQNYYYIISTLISLFAVIHNTIRPVIGNDLNTKSKVDNWRNFRIIYYVYTWLGVYFTEILVACMQDFEHLWVGKNNLLPHNIALLLAAYFFVTKLYGLLTVYQEAAGIWWQGKFIPLISSFINLFFNLFLVQIIGLYGVIISSILSTIFISLPGLIYIIFKYLFVEKSQKIWIIKYILIFIVETIIIGVVVYFLCSQIPYLGFIGIIIKAILSSIITIIFFVGSAIIYPEGKDVIKYVLTKLKSSQ